MCTALTWSALLDGNRGDSKARLDGFWADNAASGPVEMAINAWMLWATTLQSVGLLPAVSPYDVPVTGLEHFRTLLRRWVDFDRIQVDGLAGHPEPQPRVSPTVHPRPRPRAQGPSPRAPPVRRWPRN